MRKLAVRFSLVYGGETFVTGRVYEIDDDEKAARLLNVQIQKTAKLVFPFVDVTDSGEDVKPEEFTDPHMTSRRPRYTDDARVGRRPKKKVEAPAAEAAPPEEEASKEETPSEGQTATSTDVTEETTPEDSVKSEESTPKAEVSAPAKEDAPTTD